MSRSQGLEIGTSWRRKGHLLWIRQPTAALCELLRTWHGCILTTRRQPFCYESMRRFSWLWSLLLPFSSWREEEEDVRNTHHTCLGMTKRGAERSIILPERCCSWSNGRENVMGTMEVFKRNLKPTPPPPPPPFKNGSSHQRAAPKNVGALRSQAASVYYIARRQHQVNKIRTKAVEFFGSFTTTGSSNSANFISNISVPEQFCF